ncbi:MAG TPA: hypothetical protein VM452_09345 [Caulifigura sp.]|nr:hypothetical protein [Caulifigura sp.]
MIRLSSHRIRAILGRGCMAAAVSLPLVPAQFVTAADDVSGMETAMPAYTVMGPACPSPPTAGPIPHVAPLECRHETFVERFRSFHRRCSWKKSVGHGDKMFWDASPYWIPNYGYHPTSWRRGACEAGLDPYAPVCTVEGFIGQPEPVLVEPEPKTGAEEYSPRPKPPVVEEQAPNPVELNAPPPQPLSVPRSDAPIPVEPTPGAAPSTLPSPPKNDATPDGASNTSARVKQPVSLSMEEVDRDPRSDLPRKDVRQAGTTSSGRVDGGPVVAIDRELRKNQPAVASVADDGVLPRKPGSTVATPFAPPGTAEIKQSAGQKSSPPLVKPASAQAAGSASREPAGPIVSQAADTMVTAPSTGSSIVKSQGDGWRARQDQTGASQTGASTGLVSQPVQGDKAEPDSKATPTDSTEADASSGNDAGWKSRWRPTRSQETAEVQGDCSAPAPQRGLSSIERPGSASIIETASDADLDVPSRPAGRKLADAPTDRVTRGCTPVGSADDGSGWRGVDEKVAQAAVRQGLKPADSDDPETRCRRVDAGTAEVASTVAVVQNPVGARSTISSRPDAMLARYASPHRAESSPTIPPAAQRPALESVQSTASEAPGLVFIEPEPAVFPIERVGLASTAGMNPASPMASKAMAAQPKPQIPQPKPTARAVVELVSLERTVPNVDERFIEPEPSVFPFRGTGPASATVQAAYNEDSQAARNGSAARVSHAELRQSQ